MYCDAHTMEQLICCVLIKCKKLWLWDTKVCYGYCRLHFRHVKIENVIGSLVQGVPENNFFWEKNVLIILFEHGSGHLALKNINCKKPVVKCLLPRFYYYNNVPLYFFTAAHILTGPLHITDTPKRFRKKKLLTSRPPIISQKVNEGFF